MKEKLKSPNIEENTEILRKNIENIFQIAEKTNSKYTGSIVEYYIRNFFINMGFKVSQRHVFVSKQPIEFDFFLLNPHVDDLDKLEYDSKEIFYLIDTKYDGIQSTNGKYQITDDEVHELRQNFKPISGHNFSDANLKTTLKIEKHYQKIQSQIKLPDRFLYIIYNSREKYNRLRDNRKIPYVNIFEREESKAQPIKENADSTPAWIQMIIKLYKEYQEFKTKY